MADQSSEHAAALRIVGYGAALLHEGDVAIRGEEAGWLYELARAGMAARDDERAAVKVRSALDALRIGAALHADRSVNGRADGPERAIPTIPPDTGARVPINVAAAQLGVSARQVRRLLRAGRLTGTSTRPLLVDVESLSFYAARRRSA